MGGKSRKTGGISKALIERVKAGNKAGNKDGGKFKDPTEGPKNKAGAGRRSLLEEGD